MSDAPADTDTGYYLVFTADVPEDIAARRFESRFGVPPQQIVEYNRQLWLGPVPDQKKLPIANR